MFTNGKIGRPRAEAAERISKVHGIPCQPSTLANKATKGTGPVYRIISGRAYYLDEDTDAWAVSRVGRPVRKARDSSVVEPPKVAGEAA